MFKNLFGDYRFRILLLCFAAALGLLTLILRLHHEQVRRSDDYLNRISRQSLRRIRVPARRGKIFSRDHLPLADNAAGGAILFYPEEMRRPGRRANTVDYIEKAAAEIAAVLKRPNPLSRESIERHLNVRPGLPITLFGSLSIEEAAPALERFRNYDGIGLEEDDVRRYPQGELAFHLIGYTRNDNPRAAEDRGDFFYYVPDQVGKAGLEEVFDECAERPDIRGLRGVPGFSVVQVDNQGFVRATDLASRPPQDGNHLVLTLDFRAQQIAERVLSGSRGAMVLLDADTGDVLAMASQPTADLRKFTPTLSGDYYRELRNDPGLPLWNRAISGTYMPGSILKVLIAMAILEKGIDPAATVNCTGRVHIGDGSIGCSSRYGHGEVNLVAALEKSCNSYFIEYGMKAGLAGIADVLARAGLGRRSGLELRDRPGVLPSDDYKRRYYRTTWNRFDTALLSIGQGIILLTPLQAAVYTAAIANGGRVLRPHLTRELVDSRGEVLWRRRPEAVNDLKLRPEHLEKVREGMFQVVNSTTGTGRLARNPVITLAGKTGSAEVGPRDDRYKNTFFIGYGRHEGRTYAIAVAVEHGVSGGNSCAPLAARFFSEYLGNIAAHAPVENVQIAD